MRSRSIIARTIGVVLMAELLCALAFSAVALEHERTTHFRAFDIMLRGRSDSVLGAIQDAEDPEDNVLVDPAELRLPPEDLFAVYKLDGGMIGSSPGPPEVVIQRGEGSFSNRSFHGRSYRVYERNALRIIDRADVGGPYRRPITIVYAAPTRHIWHEIFEAAGYYMALSLLSLTLTALLLVVSLRRILAPLETFAQEASKVSVLQPHFQAPASALEVRELAPLAHALTAAIDGLREALEAQQRFIGDAAHELKTAVAVVRSSVQVLMMRERTREEYALGLEVLLTDNSRAEELVSRMLLLARVEGTERQEAPATDLASCAQDVVTRLQPMADASGVTLTSVLSQSACVRLAAEKAEVLLENLIVNAVQHSPAGTQVQVRCRTRGNCVTLEVEDHGSGIAPDALPHVFERFYREDTSRSRKTGGAGLGLAICRSIVERGGGRIGLESAPGRGTLVSVTLPASE